MDALLTGVETHVFLGQHKSNLGYQYGWLLFLVMHAGVRSGVPPDDPDLRILRGTSSALGDLMERPGDEVTELDRSALGAGVLAAQRLYSRLGARHIADAVGTLARLLASGAGLTTADIDRALV